MSFLNCVNDSSLGPFQLGEEEVETLASVLTHFLLWALMSPFLLGSQLVELFQSVHLHWSRAWDAGWGTGSWCGSFSSAFPKVLSCPR